MDRSVIVENAKRVLKPGDRIRVTRCGGGGGITATYTFSHFNGYWIVSKSGIDDLSPASVFKLNGKHINFGAVK